MDYSRLTLSHLVVQHCQAAGINSVVISPGSRNAPLVMDFTAYQGFKCYSIVDERSAAFFALGIAQRSKKAVALVCTSGSALVNYFPAITEAYYSQIPLLVISADRPEQLIDRGEGQTINQKNIFGTHVIDSLNLSDNDSEFAAASARIAEVIKNMLHSKGPGHINVPMDEPLYGIRPTPMAFDFSVIQNHHDQDSYNLDNSEYQKVFGQYHDKSKKMILIGSMPPEVLSSAVLNHWSNDPSVIVLTETLSNTTHPNFITGIDQVITDLPDKQILDLKPDLLISLGGMLISKRIKKLLRAMKVDTHWHIGFERPNDTFFALKRHLILDPNDFFSATYQCAESSHSYLSHFKRDWIALRNARMHGHDTYLESIPFSDLKVHQTILASLPDGINLQMANSASIRYAQLFPTNITHSIYCNRGTSGIEGSTSTAIGSAVEAFTSNKQQTVFITGDLSFFYDINALWQKYTPESFRIIIVNNQGGGIFRILPGAKEVAPFETYLETPHERNAERMAKEFGFEYDQAKDINTVNDVLKTFYNPSSAPRMLEILTPNTRNDVILNKYFDYLTTHKTVMATKN